MRMAKRWGRAERSGVGAALVVLALLASGCTSDGGDGDAEGGPTTVAVSTTLPAGGGDVEAGEAIFEEDATFVEGECWWPRPADAPAEVTVTCGTIDVPADRSDPDTDLLTLAVARLHHADAAADAEPTVNLHGGPGGDSLVLAPEAPVAEPSLRERDLILYDQRGAGRSTPSLNCPEKEAATLEALSTADGWDVEFPKVEASVRACRDRLVGAGIDLDDYDTPASVADLETIRRAFDVDTWNVAGRSYGTRLGLSYARAHPDRVRSLFIDSVYPPDVGDVERNTGLPAEAIRELTDACDAQPACVAANGHVDEQLATAIASFDDDPEAISDGTVTINGEDLTQDYLLTGSDLAGGMFAAQYRTAIVTQLPSIIRGLADGDRSIVTAFLSTGLPGMLEMSEGAFYSFECADSGRAYGADGFEAMREDPGADALYAFGTAEPFCQVWDVPEVPASWNEPVDVDVPTMVVAGTLDPITPYEESKAQAERLPDAVFVSVPGAGHGAASFDDCTIATRDAFWDDPTSGELAPCVAALRPPAFTT